jgi:hypothetical protein
LKVALFVDGAVFVMRWVKDSGLDRKDIP